ncbi:DUF5979 domain-containing protein [Actinomyces slackii]|uniref:DUF7926 domain-containing protein n=1 Tax=Actinomyces slackii TaxID=52774 RepID=UPI00041EECA3|nr:DUF5979 domain-containing protein [Actinomyces slackii]
MPSLSSPRSLRGAARTTGVLAVLLAMIGALLVVLPHSAQAATNERIIISDLSLISSDANGNEDPSDTSVKVDDFLKLSFSWDGSAADIASGDSFQITLPDFLRNRETIPAQPLSVQHNGTTVDIGSCALEATTITCTFNDKLTEVRDQGFNGFRGKGSALLVATQATELDTAEINANGQITQVAIPGGKISENVGLNYEPEGLRKWAFPVTASSTAVDWEISFGFPRVQEALAAAGTPIIVDGQTRSTITLTDTLEPGQVYVEDPSAWKLEIGTARDRSAVHGQVTDASGADKDTSQGDFDLSVTVNGNTATITVTGPFAPDTNYIVYYASTPISQSGTVQPGMEYTNRASLVGTDLSSSFTVYYTKSFSIEVTMERGFGGFSVTKLLSGEAADKVKEGTSFDVVIDYQLPGSNKVSDYADEGWKAPGTINDSQTGGRTTMKVTVGEITTFNGTFPAGTIITPSEDPTTASPAPAGVTWGAPRFSIGDLSGPSFTIGDQQSAAVFLRNSAQTQDVPATGRFAATKNVEGAEALEGDEFSFTYECLNGSSGSFTLTEHNERTQFFESPELPAGTQCTITETNAERGGHTVVTTITVSSPDAAPGDTPPVTTGKAATVTIPGSSEPVLLSVVNTYTPRTPDEPEPQPTPDEPEPQPTPDEPEPQPTPDEPEPQPTPDEPEPQPTPDEPEPTETPTQEGSTPAPSAPGSSAPGQPQSPDSPTPSQPSGGLASTGAGLGLLGVGLTVLVAGAIALRLRRRA